MRGNDVKETLSFLQTEIPKACGPLFTLLCLTAPLASTATTHASGSVVTTVPCAQPARPAGHLVIVIFAVFLQSVACVATSPIHCLTRKPLHMISKLFLVCTKARKLDSFTITLSTLTKMV
jgi:hypothetical protein